MRIRKRALMTLATIGFVLFVLSGTLLTELVNRYFDRSELKVLTSRASSAKALLLADAQSLSNSLLGYSDWDDLRKWVISQSLLTAIEVEQWDQNVDDFLTSNFHVKSAENEKRDGVMIVSNKGTVLFSTYFNKPLKQNEPIEPQMSSHLLSLIPAHLTKVQTGFTQLPNGEFAVVAFAPIRNSAGDAKSVGKVFFFRLMNAEAVQGFAKGLGFKFELAPATSEINETARGMDQVFSVDLATNPGNPGQPIRARSIGQVSLLSQLGIRLPPSLDSERNFVLQILVSTYLILVGIFSFAFFLAVSRWCIRPLEQLSLQISDMIHHSTTLSSSQSRIQTPSLGDEFEDLSNSFNQLIDRIVVQDKHLRQKDKLALLGTLQAEFSHEVANPLSAIIALIQDTSETLEFEHDLGKVSQNLKKTEVICEHLLSLLHSFRTASRAEKATGALAASGHSAPEASLQKSLDIAKMIASIKSKTHGVKLVFPETLSSAQLKIDQPTLLQVLNNLLSNAIDAARESDEKWVKITHSLGQEHSILEIVDSGSGIPESIKKNLFQKFVTSKSSEAGTGIGLAHSHDLITLAGGELRHLEDRKNTTFQIILPLSEPIAIAA